MWNPTHVNVVVQRVENLLIKGKNGSNNAFVAIELGKESYRTSIKENSGKSVFWNEECELKIPKSGNNASLVLTAFHRNTIGLDQFLGTVKIPLNCFDKYQLSERWFKLEGKPGKEKGKEKVRGELKIEISFFSKAQSQSLTSLQSNKKNSIERLTGSLFGLGSDSKKLGWKKLSKSIGKVVTKKKKSTTGVGEVIHENINGNLKTNSNVSHDNLDPGVISDEDESKFQRSFENIVEALEQTTGIEDSEATKPKSYINNLKNPRISISNCDDNTNPHLSSYLNISEDSISSSGSRKSGSKQDKRLSTSCVDFTLFSSPKPNKKFLSSSNLEKNQGETHKRLSKFAKKLKRYHSLNKSEPNKIIKSQERRKSLDATLSLHSIEYKNKNKDELIKMVIDLQKTVNCVSIRVNDLEDYLDNILLKVMETVPKILEK